MTDTTRKPGRPRKDTTEKTATPAGSATDDKLKELQAQVAELTRINSLLRGAQDTTGPKVTIRSSGHGPDMVFKYDGQKPVILGNRPPHNVAVLSLESYIFHRDFTDWFKNGWVYVPEEENDNPNLILDIPEWIEANKTDLRGAVEKISSRSTLYALLAWGKDHSGPTPSHLVDVTLAQISALYNITMARD